jgi:hypothetical protein
LSIPTSGSCSSQGFRIRRTEPVKPIDARPANAPNDDPQSAPSRSRYHFEEVGANTLRIKGEGRTTVTVGLACAGRGFGAEYAGARPFGPEETGVKYSGLFDYHRPSQQVAGGLMDEW